MATAHQHLDSSNNEQVPSGAGKLVAIVRAEWNHEITSGLSLSSMRTILMQ
jgi:6,7-dimethyl-8-ribityllumazine synthase